MLPPLPLVRAACAGPVYASRKMCAPEHFCAKHFCRHVCPGLPFRPCGEGVVGAFRRVKLPHELRLRCASSSMSASGEDTSEPQQAAGKRKGDAIKGDGGMLPSIPRSGAGEGGSSCACEPGGGVGGSHLPTAEGDRITF